MFVHANLQVSDPQLRKCDGFTVIVRVGDFDVITIHDVNHNES